MDKRSAQGKNQICDLREGDVASQETREPANARESGLNAAVRLPRPPGPAGETGVLPAIHVPAEGIDRNESQDASRTTAENAAVPVAEKVFDKVHDNLPQVLIVEDTPELAELIRITLERNAIRAVVETNAHQALERFYELKPDVVLLDIGLPDMTGWKLLDTLRDEVGDSAMPKIIVITAYGDAANRLVGKFQNVYDYLVKPFTSEEITGAVRKALSGPVR